MADPLRRTILAKLRGKKPKGKDANRAREGKEKVSQTQSDRDYYLSREMRTGPGSRDPDSHRTRAPVPGVSDHTEPKRFHTIGDSIGFGSPDSKAQTEALDPTDGQDQTRKQTHVTLREQKSAEISTTCDTKTSDMFDYIDGNIQESDLIQVLESALEYHGDFRMQNPSFFPTELEITVAPGAPRHHSVDSEDDDYYDNQILPFYEPYVQNHANERNVVEKISSKTALETNRLKSQLKEAYYLLLNISFDGQVEDNGFVEDDSVSSVSSGLSSGRLCTVLGLTESRSLENIPNTGSEPVLQRSVSDSRVTYSLLSADPPLESVHELVSANTTGVVPTTPGARRSRDGPAHIHPGVTVNKMQEWMQKGRVLSTEMKHRIAGSSVRPKAAPMECVAGSSGVYPRDFFAPFNHITVSKKRNWLQQSVLRPRLADDNDADDEGEIWYNPIPEDEEPDSVPAITVSHTGPVIDGDGAGERPTLTCKTQEENLTVRATDPSEQSTGGLSPSSSPNPAKRSTAINWSFPDKIKSPRTVRKLSMKMKKLPDLSRKLSVKGTPSNVSISNGQSEPRAHSPRANGIAELGQSRPRLSPSGVTTALASGNVIWRYHLDSSVSTQHNFDKRRSNCGGIPKSASKGGYLSDGDSPELVAKSGKHGNSERKNYKVRDPNGNGGSPKLPGTELDIDAFRSYSFSEQPKCLTFISGLMSLHFYGAEDLKPPRVDSRNVYCAIQVDSVNKARTALLTCRTAFLDMDHTFNIDLENAQHLKLVVFSWESTPRRNRVCCHGSVILPALFRVSKTHQLAVRLEPRGMIYVKLSLMEQRQNSLDGPEGDHETQVFGVEARRVVEREASGLMVPLLIEKCISEIERRGCQVVGLYRLCGSAAVKKELREAFERDSHSVELSENNYPDINVITGVLKDFLRELPRPLITPPLYESVLESMSKRPLLMGTGVCENDPIDTDHAVSLMEILPDVEKASLRKLLDHLKRVASHHEVNKMTCQNLAVCFGPVLLSQRQEASCHGNRVFIDSEELASALHFKKHIEVLHYLLQLWPVVDAQGKSSSPVPALMESLPVVTAAVRRRKERPQVLNLTEADMAGVLRPRPGRLDSPSNRYAGDWSRCRETYLQPSCLEEADYDDVPSEEPLNVGQEDLPKGTEVLVPEQEFPEVDEAMERVEEMQIEEELSEEEDTGELDRLQVEEPLPISPCDQILPDYEEHRPKEHTYQAYMKIQEISPVLSNRVNLRDLQESIDTLIGNLERELNKNKLNVGY
ncbi:hypothetical protein R3I93_019197 [Phoxinus phoxinus]|uniref:Rho-GAP domain-containing protein n=2 Tax=Phoxinus phoxinus TaxID=58324 RepID=A0AAN9CEM0_9TELE